MAELIKDYIDNALSKAKKEGNRVTVAADGAVYKLTGLITAYLAQGKEVQVVAEDGVLSDVFARLPEKVRAATQYKNTDAEQHKPPVELSAKEQDSCKRALKDKINALKDLKIYADTVCGNDVVGGSYYDALDYILGAKAAAAEFAEPEKVARITPDGYAELVKKVTNAAGYYAVMAQGGDITLCPWFGAEKTAQREQMLAAYSGVKRVVQNVLGYLRNAPDTLTLVNVLAALADNVLEKDEMKNLLDLKRFPCDFRRLEQLINDFNSVFFTGCEKFDMAGSESEPSFDRLLSCKADDSLTYEKLTLVCKNSDIFVRCGKYVESLPFEKLSEIRHRIAEITADRNEYMRDALAVFDKLGEGDGEFILKAYDKLRAYRSGAKVKPAFFDFGAKSLHKKLSAFSSGSPSFGDALNAVCSYSAASACGDEIASLKRHICKILGRELADKEFESLDIVVGQYENNNLVGLSVCDYLIEAQRAKTLLGKCLKERKCPDNFVIADFIKAYKLHIRRMTLGNTVDSVLAAAKIEYNGRELQTLACSLALVMRTAELFGDSKAVTDFLDSVRASDKPFMNDMMTIVNELIRFGRTYFQGYYTRNPFALTLGDLKTFIKTADDEGVLDAALSYNETVKRTKLLPLDKFFAYFESGEIAANKKQIVEIFSASFYRLAAENKRISLGKRRNGLGKHALASLEKYLAAEKTLTDAMSGIASGRCLLRTEEDKSGKYDVILSVSNPVKKKAVCGKNFARSVEEFLAANGIGGGRIAAGCEADGAEFTFAVMSEDFERPVLYIVCERPYGSIDAAADRAVRLQALGGRVPVHRIFIHDWTDNEKSEKARLLKAVGK